MAATLPGGHLHPFAGQSVELARTQATAALSVSSISGIVALQRMASEIDRLNLASARPNPFMSSAFLSCYALRSEYHSPGLEERLFLIREGERLIGCAPMRLSVDDFGSAVAAFPRLRGRLRFLAPFDTEQRGILAAPEDEGRVAAALIAHLCEQVRGWGMLEFAGQRPGSALHRAAHARTGRRYRTRDYPVEPYNEIAVVWDDLAGYFQSLTKKMRSNISRQARRLFASGEPELILADGAPAVSAWFDAYCELDGRSWKHGGPASIRRHPRRVRFYREFVGGRAGFDPSFIGVVLDGVLIAALLTGANATAAPESHGAWCLEMAYDQCRADLGPGQLLLLLAVGEAIDKGHAHLSFMQQFAYYKHRWGAQPIDVVNVQVIRRASLHNIRAWLGELRSRSAAARPQAATTAPVLEGCEADGHAVAGPGTQERMREPTPTALTSAALTSAALTSAALAYAGPGVRRLGRDAARAHLPFGLE